MTWCQILRWSIQIGNEFFSTFYIFSTCRKQKTAIGHFFLFCCWFNPTTLQPFSVVSSRADIRSLVGVDLEDLPAHLGLGLDLGHPGTIGASQEQALSLTLNDAGTTSDATPLPGNAGR